MVEVADASGGTWRELDAHYVHQSRMIGMAVDIQAWTVGSRQLDSSSQPSRPATDDAPAATLRAGLHSRARSLAAVTNVPRSR